MNESFLLFIYVCRVLIPSFHFGSLTHNNCCRATQFVRVSMKRELLYAGEEQFLFGKQPKNFYNAKILKKSLSSKSPRPTVHLHILRVTFRVYKCIEPAADMALAMFLRSGCRNQGTLEILSFMPLHNLANIVIMTPVNNLSFFQLLHC